MHLCRPSFRLVIAEEHWHQVVASSCFATGGLASIDFAFKIVAEAFAKVELTAATVHWLQVAFTATCLQEAANH